MWCMPLNLKNITRYFLKKNNSNSKNCDNIIENKVYHLKLKTELLRTGIWEHVSGLMINDEATISIEEDSIIELYSTKNLKGLCYKK